MACSRVLLSSGRTGLGKVKALFEQVGNKAEEGDEAPKGGANNVEVGDGKSRHFLNAVF